MKQWKEFVKKTMDKTTGAALDLLLPRRCPLCRKLSDGICEACRKKLPYIKGAVCFRCGRPLADKDAEYCPACSSRQFAFTQGRALYLYTDVVKESLHAVKYHNKREYLEYYAQELAWQLGEILEKWAPQVLIPVPMHFSAQRKRGYNQAGILAKELGRQLALPVRCNVLRKVKKTANQKELDYRARRSNLKGAFAVAKEYMAENQDDPHENNQQEITDAEKMRLPWERVLLIDDVYTTGSTLHEAASVLKRAGVKYVYFVTICAVPEIS